MKRYTLLNKAFTDQQKEEKKEINIPPPTTKANGQKIHKRNIIGVNKQEKKETHWQTTIRKTTSENFPGGTEDGHLPASAQGTPEFDPDPGRCHMLRQLKAKSHSYRAPVPQLLKPRALRASAPGQEKHME